MEELKLQKTINGIDLYDHSEYVGSMILFTKDHELTVVINEHGTIISCMFRSVWGDGFNKYKHILHNQKIKRLSISNTGIQSKTYTYDLSLFDLDNLDQLLVDVQKTDEIIINPQQQLSKFNDLVIRGPKPKNFLNLPIFPKICRLEMMDAKDKASLELISKCQNMKDCIVYGLKQDDLTVFSQHKQLKRLCVSQSSIKSLNGISQMESLETLHIVATKSLYDVDELFHVKKLKNINRKISDWSFLAQKEDWNAICVDVAENIDFLQKLPNIKHFYCEKVLNADDKSEKWFRLGDGARIFYDILC